MADEHDDLFAWAETRSTATILDAVARFDRRRTQHDARLAMGMFVPPAITGDVIDAEPVRRIKVEMQAKLDARLARVAVRRARQATRSGEIRPAVLGRHEVSHGG